MNRIVRDNFTIMCFVRALTRALTLAPAAVFALMMLYPAGMAHAQEEHIKPQVMLLLDTSGSMQWSDDYNDNPVEGIQGSHDYCEIAPKGGAPDAGWTGDHGYRIGRSRWNQVLDVLLGPIIDNYNCTEVPARCHGGPTDKCQNGHCTETLGPCRIEQAYYPDIPHFLDTGLRDTSRGILNKYREHIRFGLMTLDPSPDPRPDQIGVYSYGEDKHFCDPPDPANPECPLVNAGIRNDLPDAGRLISPENDYGGRSAMEINFEIQGELHNIQPINCSPLGAAIDDAEFFFSHEPDVLGPMTTPQGSDEMYHCREKYVVMLTDGRPSYGLEFDAGCDPQAPTPLNPECPWRSSFEEARELFDLAPLITDPGVCVPRIKLIVVGFMVPENHPAREWLLRLGAWGWHEADDGAGCITEPPPWSDPVWIGLMDGGTGEPGHCPEVCAWKEFEDAGPPLNEFDEGYALFADNVYELLDVFDLILGVIGHYPSSWAHPAATTKVHSWVGSHNVDTEHDAQYEFYTEFQPGAGVPWRGFLDKKVGKCNPDEVQDQNPEDELFFARDASVFYAEGLFQQAQNPESRKIFTSDGGTNSLIDILPGNLNDSDICMCENSTECDCPDESNDYEALEKHLRGRQFTNTECTGNAMERYSARRDHPLGDMYHSSPVILNPATQDIPVPAYNRWRNAETLTGGSRGGQTYGPWSPSSRPPQVFVATNEGMLHSFNAWWDPASPGIQQLCEFWGYVPRSLLTTVPHQFPMPHNGEDPCHGSHSHLWGIDATPVVADVRFVAFGESIENEGDWGSVLVGGFRQGQRGYYAVNVTDPINPVPMWEKNNMMTNFHDLGETYGQPAITYVWAQLPGDANPMEHAVALLPGGYIGRTSPLSGENIDCEDALYHDCLQDCYEGGYCRQCKKSRRYCTECQSCLDSCICPEHQKSEQSRGLYIVRLLDGKFIKYLDPDNVGDLCGNGAGEMHFDPYRPGEHYEAQLIGTPTVPYGSIPLKIAGEAYIGDDRGRVWRADFNDVGPDEWCLEVLFDTRIAIDYKEGDPDPGAEKHFQPVADPVTIASDSQKNNILIFGTGNLHDPNQIDHNRIFSLKVTPKGNTVDCSLYMYQDLQLYRNWKNDRCVSINWWLSEYSSAVETACQGFTVDGGVGDAGLDAGAPVGSFGTPVNFMHPGEKLFGIPIIFAESVYFATYTPPNPEDPKQPSVIIDPCGGGHSRIWGLHYMDTDPHGDGESHVCNAWENDCTGITVEFQKPNNKPVTGEDEFGRFMTDGGMYKRFMGNGDGMNCCEGWFCHTLIPGLKIMRRPSCYGDISGDFTQTSKTTYEIVAQRVVKPGGTEAPQVKQTKIKPIQPVRSFRFDSWSRVFNTCPSSCQ